MAKRKPVLDECPNADQHTDGPDSYLAWHYWAARMSRTHVQARCPGCDMWKIWTPKSPKSQTNK
jgi:hypothetical protein